MECVCIFLYLYLHDCQVSKVSLVSAPAHKSSTIDGVPKIYNIVAEVSVI